MPGAITQHIDAVQVFLAVFFIFFVGLIIYLRGEDEREGYPLNDPQRRGRGEKSESPTPKKFLMMNGDETIAPHHFEQPPMNAREDWGTGNRLTPLGDPLQSAVGPGTYVMRMDKPFLDSKKEIDVVPLRTAKEWSVEDGDTDPRGMAVFDAKGTEIGKVIDLWADRAARTLRYLEVQLSNAPRTILLPLYATSIKRRRREVRAGGMLASQFLNVPAIAEPDQITAREEDRINAYYAGGEFFNREAGAI